MALFRVGSADAQEVSEGWRLIGRDQGVLISSRDEPGKTHPTFRGQATIRGSVLHVLAIVLDTPRGGDWVKGADSIKIIKELDDRTQLVHMLTNLPWPIRDRDMIMKRSVEVLATGTEFRVRFACAAEQLAERRGEVRVKTCDSHFTLRAVDADKTYVDYQVQLDPGGGLPNWSIHWMEKRITVDTITRLAQQVARTLGLYAAVKQRWKAER